MVLSCLGACCTAASGLRRAPTGWRPVETSPGLVMLQPRLATDAVLLQAMLTCMASTEAEAAVLWHQHVTALAAASLSVLLPGRIVQQVALAACSSI